MEMLKKETLKLWNFVTLRLLYFQVRGSPPPLNIPTPKKGVLGEAWTKRRVLEVKHGAQHFMKSAHHENEGFTILGKWYPASTNAKSVGIPPEIKKTVHRRLK